MADDCLLYYITDRTAFSLDEPTRRRHLLGKIAEAARAGVDYIQLREKDLPTRELASLAREAIKAIRETLTTAHRPSTTALLINSRTDVALAVGADGVHLRSNDIGPWEVEAVWRKAHVWTATHSTGEAAPRIPLIGVSCHSPAEVTQAEASGATFVVFAPVFEKEELPGTNPAGLTQLHAACKANIPVLALGGITLENAQDCIEAGAAGIAAIRLFQENDVAKTVDILRRGPMKRSVASRAITDH